MNGDVRLSDDHQPGKAKWQTAYESQVAVRRAQIDRMVAFAESTECRMAALVKHFGDLTDKGTSCGLCDICNPGDTGSAQAAHQPTAQERAWLREILSALDNRSTSTGKLFTDLHLMKERKDFDTLLDGLARAALITLTNDTFRSPEGKDITYRKAAITHEGRTPDDATLDTVWLRTSIAAAPGKRSRTKKSGSLSSPKAKVGAHDTGILSPAAEHLFTQLRNWRTEIARPTKTPAFMILGDAVLRAIANTAPQNLTALHAVSGMGPTKVDRYGADLIALCRGNAPQPDKTAAKPAKPSQPSLNLSPTTPQVSAVHANKRPAPPPPAPELTPTQLALEDRLKEWRREAAKAAGLPSFFIFSDTVLRNITLAAPADLESLRNIRGVAPEKLDTFGPAILSLCQA
jgi:ATP-dependent DNA helicase RecQ